MEIEFQEVKLGEYFSYFVKEIGHYITFCKVNDSSARNMHHELVEFRPTDIVIVFRQEK